MYDIKSITLGETLKNYRKMNKMTLQEVGNKICKSKVTVCKYENDEILPDFYTLLQLCNVLNFDINELCPVEDNELDYDFDNPFKNNELYLYYYNLNKIITSIIKINKYNNMYRVRYYNHIKKNSTSYKNVYEGEMCNDRKITYFFLENKRIGEKIQMVINISWEEGERVYSGLSTGIGRDGIPVVKKILLSENKILNFEKYNSILRFSKQESKKIYKENALFFEANEEDDDDE